MRSAGATRRLQSAAIVCAILSLAACGGNHGALNGAIPPGGPGTDDAASLRGPLSMSRSARKVAALMRRSEGSGRSPMRGGGGGYPVTADPPVAHPNEAPCVDKLFNPSTPPLNPSSLPVGTFGDYNDHPFNYTPPANCPGPYAKIVFKADFHVSEGVQFDRTAAIWIGATNVFFGTTAEPGSNVSPRWQVERDVTEYAPIFAQPSVGQASVYNIVNSTYTGVIYGSAQLEFYPATKQFPAGDAADAVYPLSAGPTGGYVYLNGPTDQLAGTFTFPRNVEAAYLDVFLESQNDDEFWYSCFPNDLAQKLGNCGATGFREGEVSVDGQPAGVAPVYPWIYTGGIDPYLWVPIPGVETLNFKPYRVNLTPFAALLDDGNAHTIAVSVFNDDNYFATNAALLVYEDAGSAQVTGALVSNGTAPSPAQSVAEHVKIDPSGNAKGSIDVTATHPVNLKGYVLTSKGRITTGVTQNVTFSNVQKIDITANEFLQNITQQTKITSDTTTTSRAGTSRDHSDKTWPFTMKYLYVAQGSSAATQTADILQTRNGNGLDQRRHQAGSWSVLNTVHSSDTLNFTASGFTPSNGKSRQQYTSQNVDGRCWNKTITSRNYVLTGSMQGC